MVDFSFVASRLDEMAVFSKQDVSLERGGHSRTKRVAVFRVLLLAETKLQFSIQICFSLERGDINVCPSSAKSKLV